MSKNKIAAILLTASLVLGGCAGGSGNSGSGQESSTKTTMQPNERTVSEDYENGSEQQETFWDEQTEITEDTSAEDEKEEEPEGPPTVDINLYSEIDNFVNGISLYNKYYGVAAVDISGNVLFDIDTNTVHNDIRICKNDTFFIYEKYQGKKYLYDINGDIIISTEKQGFDDYLLVTDEYFLVYKKESTFDGDKYYVGVLDTSGNWAVPLSANLAIFNKPLVFPFDVVEVSGDKEHCALIICNKNDSYGEYPLVLYDYINDEILFEVKDKIRLDWGLKFCNNKLCYRQTWADISVNINTGETKKIEGLQCFLGDNMIIESGKGCKICDLDGNTLMDLSDYEIEHYNSDYKLDYINGNAIFIAKGKDSGYYICGVNDKGERLFDPIEALDRNPDYYSVDDNCIVEYKWGKNPRITDFKGNSKEIPIDDPVHDRLVAYDAATGNYIVGDNGICEKITVYNSDNEPILIVD